MHTYFVDWMRLNEAVQVIRRALRSRSEGGRGEDTEIAPMLGMKPRTLQKMLSPKEARRYRFRRRTIEHCCEGLRRLVLKEAGAELGEDFSENVIRAEPLRENDSLGVPATSSELETVRCRVLATQSILDIGQQPKNKSCVIQPGRELRLRSTRCRFWTNDPYDHVEKEIASTNSVFPWERSRRRFLTAEDVSRWSKEIDADLDFAIRHVLLGFPHAELQGLSRAKMPIDGILRRAEEAACRLGIRLPPYLGQFPGYARGIKEKLKTNLPYAVSLDCEPEEFRNVALHYWKRSRARFYHHRYKGDRNELMMRLGPFYDAAGNQQALPVGEFYPCRTAHPACLLVVCGTYGPAGDWTLRYPDGVRPFFDTDAPEHRVRNLGSAPIHCWFRINDDRPGDNGEGYCDVDYVILPA